jgi:hypothetical protein
VCFYTYFLHQVFVLFLLALLNPKPFQFWFYPATRLARKFLLKCIMSVSKWLPTVWALFQERIIGEGALLPLLSLADGDNGDLESK